MNTISMIGQTMAMDGRYNNSVSVKPKVGTGGDVPVTGNFPKSAAEVAESLAQNLADTKSNVEELQKISDIVMGHTLQFSVNEELGKVIIKVVDSSTNEIIREIPSEDLQKLQAHLKQAVGLIFDEII